MRIRKPRSASSLASAASTRPTHRTDASLGPAQGALTTAIQALQHAVRVLNEGAGVDVLKPQDVARRLGLNKNLTWKAARLVLAEDPFEAVTMVPGSEGAEIYLRAFGSANAPAPALQSARSAFAALDAVIREHFGGRSALESALEGLRRDTNLEQSRKAAFRANSAIFGVQVAARVTIQIVEPAKDPAAADAKGSVSMVVGLSGIRRLRPVSGLPVFRSAVMGPHVPRPLLEDGPTSAGGGFLLREFSSFPDATFRSVQQDGRLTIELLDGPIGRAGEASMYFGSVLADTFSTRREPNDTHAEFVTSVSIPAELLVSDLYVHKSIKGPEAIEASWHGTLSGPLPANETQREHARLPIDAKLLQVEAAEMPEIAELPVLRRLRDAAFAARGQSVGDFRLYRVALDYPPAPSAALVRWELPA